MVLHKLLSRQKARFYGTKLMEASVLYFQDDSASVISFTSSVHSLNNDRRTSSAMASGGACLDSSFDTKMESVDSLMTLLGGSDIDKMSTTFLAMSSTPTNCDMMRHHRVIPFLVRILHNGEQQSKEVRRRVGKALHNIVHAHPEQKQCKREAKILRLLEVLRMYADFLRDVQASSGGQALASKGCGPLRLRANHNMLICSK